MTTPHPTLAQLDAEIAGARQAFTTFYLYGPAEQAQVLGIAGTSVPRAAQAAAAAGVGTVAFAMVQQELAAARAAQAPMPWLEILDAALTAAGQAPTTPSAAAAGPDLGVTVVPVPPGRRRTVVIAAVAAVALAAAGGVTFALTRPDPVPEAAVAPPPSAMTAWPATPTPTPTPTPEPTPTPTPEPTTVEPRAQWIDVTDVTYKDRNLARWGFTSNLYTEIVGGFALVGRDDDTGADLLVDFENAEHDGLQEVSLEVAAPTAPEGSPSGTTVTVLTAQLAGPPTAPVLVRTFEVRLPAQDLVAASWASYLEVHDLTTDTPVFSKPISDFMPADVRRLTVFGTEGAVIGTPDTYSSESPVVALSLEDGSLLWESTDQLLDVLPDTVLMGSCELVARDPRSGKVVQRYDPEFTVGPEERCGIGRPLISATHIVVEYRVSWSQLGGGGEARYLHAFDRATGAVRLGVDNDLTDAAGDLVLDPFGPYVLKEKHHEGLVVVDLATGTTVLSVTKEDARKLQLAVAHLADGKLWLTQTDESFVRDIATGNRVADDHDGEVLWYSTDSGWIVEGDLDHPRRLVRPEAATTID